LQSNAGSRAFQNARQQKKLRKQAEELLPLAFMAYRQGRHGDAQTLCRRVLQDLPDYFDGLHLLGVSQIDCARFEEAAQTLERAIAIDPRSADAHSNLGFAFFKLRRYAEARRAQEQALALRPNFPTAQTNLGNTLMRLGLSEQAIEAHERAIRMKPDYADAYCNRGTTELLLEQYARAAQSFDRTLSLQPRHLQAMAGKGLACIELQHFEEAEALLSAALAVKPDLADVLAYRGRIHFQFARYAQAEADFDAALALSPDLEVAWRWKAQAAMAAGNQAKAMLACKRLLDQNPRSAIGLALLGASLAQQGEIVAAIEHLDRALDIKPDYDEAISTKIFCQDFLPSADFAAQQATRRYWWDAIGSKFPRRKLAPRSLDPARRIVVGYASGDFRTHSAAFCFLPVLRSHDKASFQVNCYSSRPMQDSLTTTFQSLADVWVDASRLSDDELANRIEADGVDILVDLSGHTAGNRLTVFARKPAPIQVTAWGHATGTGLQTMDYLFADPKFIPQDVRHLFAEHVHDLPCAMTIDPISDTQPSAPPMIRNGFVTFGVFNRIDKISDDALAAWSKLLRNVPGSRIVIKHLLLDDAFLRDGLIARFVAQGVPQDKVICMGSTARPDHLRAFENIDISLDPFPQNGGISTLESLYMGVPVVAKLGSAPSSRIAGAIVSAFGLDDWVADDDDGYLAIAQKYASQPFHLEKLRADLPARIANSPAGNVAIYTQSVEAAYRQFWRDYCATAAETA
jgi:predicted O-linked N-acetylglucosamine transferase (SPINDLY family)